ncbi:MAG TPA: hypothetical protein VII76_11480 [Acidimicrobiales bacterium]
MGILVIIGMIVLALVINPGGAPPLAATGRRTFWYSSFAESDQRLLAASSLWMSKAHHLALTTGRRGAATATWLLGRGKPE